MQKMFVVEHTECHYESAMRVITPVYPTRALAYRAMRKHKLMAWEECQDPEYWELLNWRITELFHYDPTDKDDLSWEEEGENYFYIERKRLLHVKQPAIFFVANISYNAPCTCPIIEITMDKAQVMKFRTEAQAELTARACSSGMSPEYVQYRYTVKRKRVV